MRNIKQYLIIVLVAFVCYANTFHVPFILDDLTSIVGNNSIKDLHNIGGIWRASPLRFVGNLSFAINYKLFGLDVTYFHLTNLLIHILAGFSVYWFISLLQKSPKIKDKPIAQNTLFPFFAALLFISHPIETQAITYIVQRYASLASLFYILSLTLYIKSASLRINDSNTLPKSRRFFLYFAGSIASAVCAMFTKEIAFTLPLSIMMIEIFFFTDSFRNFIKSLILILPFFLVVIVINRVIQPGTGILEAMTINLPTATISAGKEIHITRGEYFLTQINVVRTYVRLMFLPVNQNLEYDYPISRTFMEVRTILSFIFLLTLIGFATVMFFKNKLISFGIFFFFLALSVESSVIPIADVIFEHRLYLPSVGFFIATAASILTLAYKLLPGDNRKTSEKTGKPAIVIFAILILVLSSSAILRNSVWNNELSLWTDIVNKSPHLERPHLHLGLALVNSNKLDEAIGEFEKAAMINPGSVNAYNDLGSAYVKLEKLDLALSYYQKALSIEPKNISALNNLGVVYMKQGKIEKAVALYQKTLFENPENADTQFYLGLIYILQKKYDNAVFYLKKVIELNPDYELAYYYLGAVYEKQGRENLAKEYYLKSLRINPNDKEAINKLDRLEKSGKN